MGRYGARTRVVRHARNRTFIVGMHFEAYGTEERHLDAIFVVTTSTSLTGVSVHSMDVSHHAASLGTAFCAVAPALRAGGATPIYWPEAARYLSMTAGHGAEHSAEALVLRPTFDAAATLRGKSRFAAFRN